MLYPKSPLVVKQ
jgi:hypothetical protein